jgi:hypothetical protein
MSGLCGLRNGSAQHGHQSATRSYRKQRFTARCHDPRGAFGLGRIGNPGLSRTSLTESNSMSVPDINAATGTRSPAINLRMGGTCRTLRPSSIWLEQPGSLFNSEKLGASDPGSGVVGVQGPGKKVNRRAGSCTAIVDIRGAPHIGDARQRMLEITPGYRDHLVTTAKRIYREVETANGSPRLSG